MSDERHRLMEEAIREALASNMIGTNEPTVTISLASYQKMEALFPRTLPERRRE